jgi:ECF sigma factor
MSEVTVLLSAGPDCRPVEFDRLYELLYQELHQLAHARIRRSGELTLLDTTALVHEAYLRFEHHEALSFSNRGQFMAYAARGRRSSKTARHSDPSYEGNPRPRHTIRPLTIFLPEAECPAARRIGAPRQRPETHS